jgi:hypothetical protein
LGQEEDSLYDERRFGGYSDFIGEGELKLDQNGEALIPVTAKTHDMPYTYTVEADVTDASSRQVSSSATINVVPSLVAAERKVRHLPGQPRQSRGYQYQGGRTGKASPNRCR